MNLGNLETLQVNLSTARGLLWKQIAAGGFNNPNLAKATFDCYRAVDKALTLALEDLAQLPLMEENREHATT